MTRWEACVVGPVRIAIIPTMRKGWRTPLIVLACGMVVLLVSFGLRSSLGLFLRPMSADLGWGREVFAFAMALQNLLWGLSQPIAGAIADRYGSGRVIAGAALLYVLGLYLMSAAATPIDLSLSGGVLIGIALSGTGFPVVLAVIGRSVPESRRSMYLGIGSAGGSSGQVLVVPMSHGLLTGFGWSGALLALAASSLVMVPLAAALAGRRDPAHGGDPQAPQSLGSAVGEAARHRGYWLLTAGFFVCGFHVSFISTHLPAYIADQGIDPAYGATGLALIGLGNIIGSLGCGALGGRYPKKNVLCALYLARAVLMAGFLVVPVSITTLIIFSFTIGLMWLGTVPLTSGLVAHLFGVRYMATLFGFVFFSHQIGSFLGVWYGGYTFDRTGNYDAVWWVSVALGLISAALHWPIRERPLERAAPAG